MGIKIMKSLSLFVALQFQISGTFCAFICNDISDTFITSESHENVKERIQAMEEQILQLQRLAAIGFENVTTSHKDTLPTDCAEIYDRGIKADGVYIISPDGRCPFRVYCDMTNGGWTVIQRHADGKVNFYRPWTDYVAGFGRLEGDHWLGLDKIHRLTKAGTQVFFHMENFDGSFEYAHYQAFTVHDVTTAYTMNVDTFGYQGTLKELLSYHDNMKFSTYDRDNDNESSKNCCEFYGGGGWWYNSCYRFNPNGVYGLKNDKGINHSDGGDTPVKTFLIKIKRRHGLC